MDTFVCVFNCSKQSSNLDSSVKTDKQLSQLQITNIPKFTTANSNIEHQQTSLPTNKATGPGSSILSAPAPTTVTTSLTRAVEDAKLPTGDIPELPSFDATKIILPPIDTFNQPTFTNNETQTNSSKYDPLDCDLEAAIAQSRLEHQKLLGHPSFNPNLGSNTNNNNNNNNDRNNTKNHKNNANNYHNENNNNMANSQYSFNNIDNLSRNKNNNFLNENHFESLSNIRDNFSNLSLNSRSSLSNILIDEYKIVDVTDDLFPRVATSGQDNIFDNLWQATFKPGVSSSIYINQITNRVNKGQTVYMSLRYNSGTSKYIGANNLVIFGGGFKIDADTFGASSLEKQWWTNTNWAQVGGVYPSGRFLHKVPTIEEAKHQFPGCSDSICREAINWIRFSNVIYLIKKINFMKSHVQKFSNIKYLSLPVNRHKLPEKDTLTNIINVPNYGYSEYLQEEIEQYFESTSTTASVNNISQQSDLSFTPIADRGTRNNLTSWNPYQLPVNSVNNFATGRRSISNETKNNNCFTQPQQQNLPGAQTTSDGGMTPSSREPIGIVPTHTTTNNLNDDQSALDASPGELQPTAAIRRRLPRATTGAQRFENMDYQPSRQQKSLQTTNGKSAKNVKNMKDNNKKRSREVFSNDTVIENLTSMSCSNIESNNSNSNIPPSIVSLASTESNPSQSPMKNITNNSQSQSITNGFRCTDSICNCGQTFKSRNGLNDHIKEKKNENLGILFYCPFPGCAVTKYLKKKIKQHVPSHHDPFECLFCHTTFSQKSHCERHIKKRHQDQFVNVQNPNFKKHVKTNKIDYATMYANSGIWN